MASHRLAGRRQDEEALDPVRDEAAAAEEVATDGALSAVGCEAASATRLRRGSHLAAEGGGGSGSEASGAEARNGAAAPGGFCSDSTWADSDTKGLRGAGGASSRSACQPGAVVVVGGADAGGAQTSPPSVSLVDLAERDRHFQKRELALLLWRGGPAGARSAQ